MQTITRNSWLKACSILLIPILISSCGQSRSFQGQDINPIKIWTEDEVFQQAIDLSIVKGWGYFDNSYSDKTEIVNFANQKNTESSELVAVKPIDCTPLAVLLEDSADSGAKYILKQYHANGDAFPSQSMIFRVFAYDNEDKSKKAFEAVKPIASRCGNYIAKRTNDVLSQDLWQEATIVNENLIEAFNLEFDEANALGRVGSAIFYIYFINYKKMDKSKGDLEKAIKIVSENLAK
jgi:hypothetical protein